jgi:hypothetical protein
MVMTLFNEAGIRNKMIDDEVWVNISDLANFFMDSTKDFAETVFQESVIRPLNISEAMLFRGMAEGMMNVVALLSQGGLETEFHEKIHTVEDLMKTLKKEKE